MANRILYLLASHFITASVFSQGTLPTIDVQNLDSIFIVTSKWSKPIDGRIIRMTCPTELEFGEPFEVELEIRGTQGKHKYGLPSLAMLILNRDGDSVSRTLGPIKVERQKHWFNQKFRLEFPVASLDTIWSELDYANRTRPLGMVIELVAIPGGKYSTSLILIDSLDHPTVGQLIVGGIETVIHAEPKLGRMMKVVYPDALVFDDSDSLLTVIEVDTMVFVRSHRYLGMYDSGDWGAGGRSLSVADDSINLTAVILERVKRERRRSKAYLVELFETSNPPGHMWNTSPHRRYLLVHTVECLSSSPQK